MQSASLNLSVYPQLVSSVIDHYSHLNNTTENILSFKTNSSSPSSSQNLRIGWVSGDISYHPVARFMLSLFDGNIPKNHSHVIFDSCHHGSESKCEWFKSLDYVNYQDLGDDPLSTQVQKIRDYSFDVVVDLSGWTSNHFMRGFIERLAPVQVTYLGYFASTGIPSMDYWLGDNLVISER